MARGEDQARRPTLEDVAAQAGVSRSLVSIIMRGAYGASPETRQRVLQAAEQLGYRPDARARLLALSRSRTLGVVFSVQYGFHLEFLDGLYAAAGRVGYELVLSGLTAHRDERRAMEALLDFRCEAAILLTETAPYSVLAKRLPVVAVGWQVDSEDVDVVRISDEDGMRHAVEHLSSLGHRAIVHVDGGSGPVAVARREAYRAAMRARGLTRHAAVVPGGHTQAEGASAARHLLGGGELPTAVVAFNDEVAAGLVETLVRVGVDVPGSMSVIGYDDTSVARLPFLNLTSVRQDASRLASLAVERAVARVEGQPVADRQAILPAELIVRGSTTAAPARTDTRRR
jgi:DNA-binding LacI/PurR family transcriptional regulator